MAVRAVVTPALTSCCISTPVRSSEAVASMLRTTSPGFGKVSVIGAVFSASQICRMVLSTSAVSVGVAAVVVGSTEVDVEVARYAQGVVVLS